MTTKAEQETVICFNADDTTARIWTACPTVKRKMDRLKIAPASVSTRGGQEASWSYVVPASELRWKVGRRKVSDAARKAASERLSQARQRKTQSVSVGQ